MRFIDEKTFLDMMARAGIRPCGGAPGLCFEDEEAALGFDFMNLSIPDTSISPYETQGPGDRGVEYAMAGAMIRILEELGLFPLYLYAVDDEWAGEDPAALAARGIITAEEGELLASVMDGGHGMDVIILEKGESADAVRLIAPQLTAFSTSCAAADEKGRVIVIFSQDEEVAFNTRDRAIYEKAKEMAGKLHNPPFDIVLVD